MAIEKVEGVLELLGSSETRGTVCKYSVIQIGDRRLENMVFNKPGMNSYLTAKGLKSEQPITLWYSTNTRQVQGVLIDGVIYAEERYNLLLGFILILLFCCIVIGFAWLPFYFLQTIPDEHEWREILAAMPNEKVFFS